MKKTFKLLRKGFIILSIVSLATFGAFADGGSGGNNNNHEEEYPKIIVRRK